jgi:hypothetical protein
MYAILIRFLKDWQLMFNLSGDGPCPSGPPPLLPPLKFWPESPLPQSLMDATSNIGVGSAWTTTFEGTTC